MKHLKTFENFDSAMIQNNNYPSVEDMKAYVCGCGYDEMEVEEMSYSQVCSAYDTCKMEMNEARKYKRKQAERKAKKAKPDFLDLDKDGDKKETMKKAYADKKSAQGKGTQKEKEAQKKPQSQAQGKLSAAQKKLPPALQKAIMNKRK